MIPPTLVLAAGLGTRLDPVTRVVAKPAVPLGDKTLIEHVLGWLSRQSVRDVVINLHHLPASVTAVVGDGAHLNLSVRYSWEQPILGSAGGPRRALPLLAADEVLIVNGDTLCDLDLVAMLAAHHASGADVTMAVVPNPAPHHYNGIAADANGVVTGFLPRGQADGTWHFVGVQVARARVFEGLEDGVPAETVAGFYRELVATRPGCIRTWITDRPFLDVGTPRDYLAAAALAGEPPARTPAPNARIVRSIVWPQVAIGAGVTLEDCVAIGGISLPSGFIARSAVLAPARIARPGEAIEIRDGIAVFPL